MARKKKYIPKHSLVKKYVPKEFWEIADSAYDHIGDILSNSSPKELAELLPVLFCAYIGFDVGEVKGAAIALLGYQLSMAEGTPSQIAGLAILSSIGLLSPAVGKLIPGWEDRARIYDDFIKAREKAKARGEDLDIDEYWGRIF